MADDEMATVRKDDLDVAAGLILRYVPDDALNNPDVRASFGRLDDARHEDAGAAAEPEADLPPDGQWCIVELLGHRERRGYVTQVERFGTALLHIDLAAKLWDGDAGAWEEYAGAALYGMHPTTPAEVRATWEREKERDRKQQEWREREAARWAALPSVRDEPAPYDGDHDQNDDPDDGYDRDFAGPVL